MLDYVVPTLLKDFHVGFQVSDPDGQVGDKSKDPGIVIVSVIRTKLLNSVTLDNHNQHVSV